MFLNCLLKFLSCQQMSLCFLLLYIYIFFNKSEVWRRFSVKNNVLFEMFSRKWWINKNHRLCFPPARACCVVPGIRPLSNDSRLRPIKEREKKKGGERPPVYPIAHADLKYPFRHLRTVSRFPITPTCGSLLFRCGYCTTQCQQGLVFPAGSEIRRRSVRHSVVLKRVHLNHL